MYNNTIICTMNSSQQNDQQTAQQEANKQYTIEQRKHKYCSK